MLRKVTMLFAVTFLIYGFIPNVTTSQSIAIENYKMIRNNAIAKNVVKNIVPFSQLSHNQNKKIK